MASYSSLLRFVNQVIGENPDTWGDVADEGVFQVLEDAIAATANIVLAGTDVTLTTVNGAPDQARCAALDLNGGLSADVNVIVPNTSKLYVARNRTTSQFHVTVKTAAGVGVVVPQNETKLLLVVAGTGVIEVGTLPVDRFFDTGLVPTEISGTSFTVPGDQTSRLFANQRLKLLDSVTLYGTVTTATFGSGLTTVVMALDSGAFTAALHKVYVGLGSPNKPIEVGHVQNAVTTNTNQTITGQKTFDAKVTHTKQAAITSVALTDAANIATDASLSNLFKVMLGGNRVLDNPTNMVDGQPLTWKIKQDGVGGRTLSYGAKFKFPFGVDPVLSTPASSVDLISGYYAADDDSIYAVCNKSFS